MVSGPKKQLLNLIKKNGEISLDEAITETGVTKTTLREHLSQLERDGYLTHHFVRYGPGRPSLRYRLTSKGHSFYPTREPELMRQFLVYLKENGQTGVIENFFREFWQKRLERVRRKLKDLPDDRPEARFNILLSVLEEEGFMPDLIELEDGSVAIRECNCPFREVVKETDLPCRLEADFFKQVFDENTERSEYIPNGDYSCSYKVNMD